MVDIKKLNREAFENEFKRYGGGTIKHLLLNHPDRDLIIETCKSVLGDSYQSPERVSVDAIVGRTKGVVCPHCEHELSDDEMYQSEVDLYALAPNEDDAIIDCPACHEKFTVHGSYTPIYETLPLEME